METLAAQPPQQEQDRQEQLRSFDPLASVNMLRFDLMTFGHVLPETKQRVCDEELSFLAEGVDRASRTDFVLRRQGDELLYFDDGGWRAYGGMLQTGVAVAEKEAKQDYRRQFLLEWAKRDQEYGYKLRALKPGQRLIWTNSFPHAVAAQYGQQFMQSCGLQPDRRLGFIYHAYCRSDGHVVLESQTVDGSDPDALAAVEQAGTEQPEADMDDLVEAYDSVLVNKYGEQFYAGRRKAEMGENAWQLIKAQEDLIVYFVEGLEKLAASELAGRALEETTKKHVYGVWATFKKRIDGVVSKVVSAVDARQAPSYIIQAQLEREVAQNFNEFARAGKVLIGCGGIISMINEQNIMDADAKDVFSAIFGKEPEDQFGPLNFTCKNGHWNKRPRGQLITQCRIKSCKNSVSC